jgi:hypothetical protein
VVLALLVLAAVGSGAYLLNSSSDSSTSIGDPVEALQAFYQAGIDDDCTKGVDLITEESWGILVAGDDFDGDTSSLDSVSRSDAIAECKDQAESGDPDEKLANATLASQDGSTAIVTASLEPNDGEPYDMDFHMVKEGGGWKVDLVATIDAYMAGFDDEDVDVDEGDLDSEDVDLDDLEEELEDLEDELGTDFTVPD